MEYMGLAEFPALSLLTIHEKGRGQQRVKGGQMENRQQPDETNKEQNKEM